MPIEVVTTFDLETMKPAREWHWRKYGLVTWLWPILGLVLIVAGGLQLGVPGRRAAFGAYCIIAGMYCILRKTLLNLTFCRAIMKSPSFGQKLVWRVDENGVSGESEGLSLKSDWNHFVETVATPEGLLLYPHKNFYYWLPRSGFTDDAEFKGAVAMAQKQTKHRALQ